MDRVYGGMIVGESARPSDIACRKALLDPNERTRQRKRLEALAAR